MNPRVFFIFLLFLASLLSGTPRSQAGTFIIADGDVVGLKSALATSNANGEDDIIDLAVNGIYTLSTADYANADGNYSGLPLIDFDGGEKLTIRGHGATIRRSASAGTPKFRIFYLLSNADLSLSDLTLSNGDVTNPTFVERGGCIYNDRAAMTLGNCVLSGNRAGEGAVIFSNGATSILNDSTFSNNQSDRGGVVASIAPGSSSGLVKSNRCTFIANSAVTQGGVFYLTGEFGGPITLIITESTFQNNSAQSGGCVYNVGFAGPFSGGTGLVEVDYCTFAGNDAGWRGGVIDNVTAGDARFNNCTFAGNSASEGGVALNQGSSGYSAKLTVWNCTFYGNFLVPGPTPAGGGIFNISLGTTTLSNTIFKTGQFGANIDNSSGGTVHSEGYNLANDTGGGFLVGPGDQTNTNPLLDPAGLQNNGGLTQTIALLPGSPAINAGTSALARDQRGYFRTGIGDIGAFEYQVGFLGKSSIARNGNDILVNAEVVRGRTYRLERKLSLTDSSWESVHGVVDLVATGNDTESITDPNATSLGRAFYHVILVP
jgi:hypothetical protein